MAGKLDKLLSTGQAIVNSYTADLLQRAKDLHGEDSHQYKGIFNQYWKMPELPEATSALKNMRHYQAEIATAPKGVERLYRRVIVIDVLSKCASECTYCLRMDPDYLQPVLAKDQMVEIAKWAGQETELREVLLTGGDPLINANILRNMLQNIMEHAPNIRFARIGTRMPVQDPEKCHRAAQMLEELKPELDAANLRVEIACQINHPFELQPEAREVLLRLGKVATLYSQNVLMKDVNDDINILLELYDELRYLGIEGHYIFDCIPIKVISKFRISVQKCLELVNELSSSGNLSGRAKPQFALMTDAGKVNMYEGSIVKNPDGSWVRNGLNQILVRSHFKLSERQEWHKGYQLPDSCYVDEDGYIMIWYQDVKSGLELIDVNMI